MKSQNVPRLYLGALLVITALNFTLILYFINRFKALLPPERVFTYVDDDFPAQLPLHLPTVGLVLEDGYPHFALRADDEWGTLFPASGGFTELGPHNRTFLLSFMHQTHCLDVIRVAYVTNRTGLAHGVEHCLRYLRQIVLCNADTTLESTDVGWFNGAWEHGASGIGSVHRCRDWTVLRRYMDSHPAAPAEAPESEPAASSVNTQSE